MESRKFIDNVDKITLGKEFTDKSSIFSHVKRYLIRALGTNDYLRKHIDEIYNKNEIQYYKAFLDFNIDKYDTEEVALNKFTAITQEYVNKVVGIVEYGYKKNNLKEIEYLIKIGYKKLYNQIKNAEYVYVSKILKSFATKNEMDLKNYIAVALYLVLYLWEKEYELSEALVEFIGHSHLVEIMINTAYDSRQDFIDKRKESIGKLYSLFALKPNEKIRDTDVKSFINNSLERIIIRDSIDIEEKLIKETQKNSVAVLKRTSPNVQSIDEIIKKPSFEEFSEMILRKNDDKEESIKDQAFDIAKESASTKTIFKYLVPVRETIEVLLGLSLGEIQKGVTINNEILELILGRADFFIEDGTYDKNTAELYIMYTLTVYALTEKYKELQDRYLRGSKDEKIKILIEQERQLKLQDQKIQLEREDMEKKYLKLQKENEELKRSMENLQRELKEIKTRETEHQISKTELLALRELVYDIEDKELEEFNERPLDDLLKEIQDEKIVVFGGHNSWKNRLKELFKNGVFYGVDDLNKDLTFIKNYDNIFINKVQNKHAYYYKIISYAEKYNKKVRFIDANNIEMAISELYRKLKK